MPKLILFIDPGKSKLVKLDKAEMTIGRALKNDVILSHDQVSRRHAVLNIDGPFVAITDLSSRNGVYVNGLKVESQILADGDDIAIGPCKLRFLADDQDHSYVDALRLESVPGLLIDLDAEAKATKSAPARPKH